MRKLKRIHVVGWKSIRDQTIELEPLNVVIGANGAGKSNLLSLFWLIHAMFASTPVFRNYVAANGGADRLLHFGIKQTQAANLELVFETESADMTYFVSWSAATGGTLIFTKEQVTIARAVAAAPEVLDLGAGHGESQLHQAAEDGNPTAQLVLSLLRSCRLFHFHDTSDNSAARAPCYVEANRFLYPDAGNLAAMLYLFREKYAPTYRRIVATVRQMVPEFGDFVLEPRRLNESQILLNWTHKDRDYELGPHQLSDGSLRFVALATLMLQPAPMLPLLMALDEPELGLHPAALELLAGMANTASLGTQVLFATQSPVFLDYFEPANVIVVHNRAGSSEFERLDERRLVEWREEYTLGEIWQKNVLGGGPYE